MNHKKLNKKIEKAQRLHDELQNLVSEIQQELSETKTDIEFWQRLTDSQLRFFPSAPAL